MKNLKIAFSKQVKRNRQQEKCFTNPHVLNRVAFEMIIKFVLEIANLAQFEIKNS